MAQAVTMTEARARLGDLDRRLHEHPEDGPVTVTRRGKPRLALMSWDRYEAMVETMEILSDPELMADVRRGEKDIAEGKIYPLEQVAAELGL